MSKCRPLPCEACPYRKDVPSGMWAAHEYEKLIDYDLPTQEQPFGVFACHASPQALCHGWVVVHMNRGRAYELLALRIYGMEGGVPEEVIELWSSGTEAARHGMRDIDNPSDAAVEAINRLLGKHARLRGETDGD